MVVQESKIWVLIGLLIPVSWDGECPKGFSDYRDTGTHIRLVAKEVATPDLGLCKVPYIYGDNESQT